MNASHNRKEEPAPPGYRWVYVPHFRHYRTGKLVFPKNGKCFRFLVKI